MITLMERLGVNVVSVVIGALFFLIAIAWVEAIRNVVEYVFFHEEGIKDYHTLQKKILAAVFVTVLSGVLIIFIYSFYKHMPVSHKSEGSGKAGDFATHPSSDPDIVDFPGVFILEGDPNPLDISTDMDDINFNND